MPSIIAAVTVGTEVYLVGEKCFVEVVDVQVSLVVPVDQYREGSGAATSYVVVSLRYPDGRIGRMAWSWVAERILNGSAMVRVCMDGDVSVGSRN